MSRPPLLAIAAISAAVLAYEVLLMRVFSIVSWHHFAYMIISIALLGFGASGSLLTLLQHRLLPRFDAAFAACATLFAVTAILGVAAAIRLPFNALAIVWDPWQAAWLGASYALLILPFGFGGAALGLAFSRFPHEIGRVYAFDLAGAGLGALGIVGVLFLLSPPATLLLVAAAGVAAAVLALLAAGGRRARIQAAGLAVAGVAAGFALPPGLTTFLPWISEYKGLATALTVPGARIVAERNSPLGWVAVVESPMMPLRHAPGLSLANVQEPPLQLGVFTDADSVSAITRFDGDRERLAYLDFTTSALPFHLLRQPRTLILGAGGGSEVLLALYHDAPRIDAVELNPAVIDLVAEDYAEFAGGIYGRSEVTVHASEARIFVAKSRERHDLIQMPLLYSFAAAAAGTQSLHESYVYTVEALGEYLDSLAPGGILSVTLWLKLPPRDSLKLFATAIEALEALGVDDPGDRLALIRSWRTTTLLVRSGPFSLAEIEAIRTFSAERSFDVVWYPGMRPEEANRYNLIDRPIFHEAASALLGPERAAFIDAYKFDIAPATDDRPFFYDFFKWRSLPELLALRTQGAAAMLDMGYLILFATLVQAAVLSLVLILAPLAVRWRSLGSRPLVARTAAYFLAIGFAFLFVEIAFIQRFVLFLGHPLYAVAVVLAGFLVFAGAGSALAPRLDRACERLRHGRGQAIVVADPRAADSGPAALPHSADALASRPPRTAGARPARLLRTPGALELAVAAIAVIALGYLALLPPLFAALIGLPDPVKIAISLALIAPLALFMGMPFPLGIALIARRNANLVPWAWAINGCASVVSAILATLLAIHFGFAAVVALAVALYLTTPLSLGTRAAPDGDPV